MIGAAIAVFAAAAVSAYGAVKSGQAQKAAAEAQSEIYRQQADRERLNAANAEEDFRRQQAGLMATRRARLAAAGVSPSEGSPLLVSEDFASETELQALRIRSGGALTATRLEQNAALTRFQGSQAQTQSYYRGGSLLLSGAGKAFGMANMPTSAPANTGYGPGGTYPAPG